MLDCNVISENWGFSDALDVPILNLLRHRQESLFNVGRVLGRSLKEWDVQLIREFLGTLMRYEHGEQLAEHGTLATLYSTTFLPVRSDLLPTRSLLTPSDA